MPQMEAVYAILMQYDDQVNEKSVAYMSQSLSDDEFKYYFIEKHAFALVKDVEKFHHFILGKHMLVKVPLPAVKFFTLIDLSFKEACTLACQYLGA
jgi:hypothetical protein